MVGRSTVALFQVGVVHDTECSRNDEKKGKVTRVRQQHVFADNFINA